MTRKIKEIIIIPADPSPESIRNVLGISTIDGRSFDGANTNVCRLDGSVEEKLQQYREFFGKEWAGTTESRFIVFEEFDQEDRKPIFGVTKAPLLQKHPIDVAVQDEIDALATKAQRYLDENTVAKEAWATLPEEEKMAIIAQRELENETTEVFIEAEV